MRLLPLMRVPKKIVAPNKILKNQLVPFEVLFSWLSLLSGKSKNNDSKMEYVVEMYCRSNDQCSLLANANDVLIEGSINKTNNVKIQWNVFDPAFMGWNSGLSSSISIPESASASAKNVSAMTATRLIETVISELWAANNNC